MVHWKDQVQSNRDDISLNVISNTLDLASIDRLEPDQTGSRRNSVLSSISAARSHGNLRVPKLGSRKLYSESSDSTEDYSSYNLGLKSKSAKDIHMLYTDDQDSGFRSLPRSRSSGPGKGSRSSGLLSPYEDPGSRSYGLLFPPHSSLPRDAELPREQMEHVAQLTRYNTVTNGDIPKLDLSFLDYAGPESARTLEKQKSPQLHRQSSYGIYGQDFDENLPSGKQNHSHNYGAQQNGAIAEVSSGSNSERYISLGYDGSAAGDFSKDVDQSRASNPIRKTSMTDTKVPLHRTDHSVNVMPRSRHAQQNPELHGATANSALTSTYMQVESDRPVPQIRDLSHAKSLPNLSGQQLSLDLTHANLDMIVNSDLTEEEKLDLMAAMCECDDSKPTVDFDPSLFNPLISTGSNHDVNQGDASTRSHPLLLNDPLPNSVDIHVPDTSVSHPSYTPQAQAQTDSPTSSTHNIPHEPSLERLQEDAKTDPENPSIRPSNDPQQQLDPDSSSNGAIKPVSVPKGPIKLRSRSQSGTKAEVVQGPLETHLKRMDSQGRAQKQNYGIDIEQWVNQQEPEKYLLQKEDSLELGDIGSITGVEECVEKLRDVHDDRLVYFFVDKDFACGLSTET